MVTRQLARRTAYAGGTIAAARHLITPRNLRYVARTGARIVRRVTRSRSRRRPTGASRRMAPEPRGTTRQSGSMDINATEDQMNELIVDEVTMPSEGIGLQDRLTSAIRIKGFKICERFINVHNYPVICHYAIIQVKDTNASTSVDIKEQFFRDTTSTSARSLDFISPSVQYDFRYDCFSMNPDRFWILTHKRFLLGAHTDAVGTEEFGLGQSRWVKSWSKYYKINKKFAFNSTGAAPWRNIFRVVWYVPVEPSKFSAVNKVTRLKGHVLYYKNAL